MWVSGIFYAEKPPHLRRFQMVLFCCKTLVFFRFFHIYIVICVIIRVHIYTYLIVFDYFVGVKQKISAFKSKYSSVGSLIGTFYNPRKTSEIFYKTVFIYSLYICHDIKISVQHIILYFRFVAGRSQHSGTGNGKAKTKYAEDGKNR